jgi:hypothetical protein
MQPAALQRGGNRFDLLFPKEGEEKDGKGGGDDEYDDDAAFVHELARRAPWVRALVNPLLGGGDSSTSTSASAAPAEEKTESEEEDEAWWCDVSIVYSRPGATVGQLYKLNPVYP